MKPYFWKICFILVLSLLFLAGILLVFLFRRLKQKEAQRKLLSSILESSRNELKASLLLRLCYLDKPEPEDLAPLLSFWIWTRNCGTPLWP